MSTPTPDDARGPDDRPDPDVESHLTIEDAGSTIDPADLIPDGDEKESRA